MERKQEPSFAKLAEKLLQVRESPDYSPKRKFNEALTIEASLYWIAYKGETNPCYNYQNLLIYFLKREHLSVQDLNNLQKAFSDIYNEAIEDFKLPDRLNLDNYIDARALLISMVDKVKSVEWPTEGRVQQKFAQHFREMIEDDSSKEVKIKEFIKVLFGCDILL